jgi:HD-GYP domain-containing protein (c-di-GMP phosphodiesterase class II)
VVEQPSSNRQAGAESILELRRNFLPRLEERHPWIKPTIAEIRKRNPDNLLYHSIDAGFAAEQAGLHLGLPESQVAALSLGGLLHDVGKLFIPREISCKPGKLTPREELTMATHAAIGERYVRIHGPQDDQTALVAGLVGSHHDEYPRPIPDDIEGYTLYKLGKILAGVDRVTAMRDIRCYRPYAYSPKEIEEELSGSHDPDLLHFALDMRLDLDRQSAMQPEVVSQSEFPQRGLIFAAARSNAQSAA